MKAAYFFITVLIVSSSAFAQEAKVPGVVKASFAKIHPAAADVKWEKEGKNAYEIGFKENGVEISVVMDGKGHLKETETTIPSSELPASVAPYIEKKYSGFKIDDGARLVSDKGDTTYEAGISKGKIKHDVMFDVSGMPLKKK